jgi:hypothetical protein
MNKILRGISAVAAVCISLKAGATATLDVRDGMLYGASGVLVLGTSYDLQFEEGTCTSVFGSCAPADSPFWGKPEAAEAASQALLDQVLVGNFDTMPWLTFGCGVTNSCRLYTIYDSYIWTMQQYAGHYAVARNETGIFQDDSVTFDTLPDIETFGGGTTAVLVLWTPAMPVPEPPVWMLDWAGVVVLVRGLKGHWPLSNLRQPLNADT